MKDENMDSSLAIARSSVKEEVKTYAERRVKLNDTNIKKYRPKDKIYSIGDSEMVGLRLYVRISGSKIFYYCYKPKNEKNWVRYNVGNFNVINVIQARDKAKKYAALIVDGIDPVLVKREMKTELTLEELIEQFYSKRFNRNYGYKPNTIEAVKTCFKVWIFQKTSSLAVRKVQKENPYSLQHKKLSTITKEDIKGLHNIIRLKAPAVANKVIKFLNVVFNYAVEEKMLSKNPVKMKLKEMAPDREDNRILTEQQRQTILDIVWKIDRRNGKINYNYYQEKQLNLVGCLIIAFWLLTGRRNVSEGNQIKWKQISLPTKKIFFMDSKVGQKQYDLGPKAVKLLKAIHCERMTPGPLFWKEGTKDYVFPSYKYGMKNSINKKCPPYFNYLRKTWKRVLKMAQIEYIPPKQCRHTFLTLLLHKSKNIMVVKEAAGHSQLKTTNRYAKILNEDVVSGLEKMDQEETKESKVLEFKK
jgi:integrase